MRIKPKTMLVAALSVVVLSALGAGASSASAAPSVALGSGTTASLAETATVKSNFTISAEGQPTIECSTLRVVGGVLTGGEASFPIKSLKLGACIDVSSPSKCEVNNGRVIETKELVAEVRDGAKSPETKEVLRPKSGEELFAFKLKNKGEESCSGGPFSNVIAKGKITTTEENNSLLSSSHSISFKVTTASKELSNGGSEALSFFGSAGLALTSGGTFAFTF